MGRSPSHRSTIIRGGALVLAAVTALTACGGNDDSASTESAASDAPMEEAAAEAGEDAFGDDAEDAITFVDGRAQTGGLDDIGAQIDLSDRDIITSVSLTISTADVRATSADVRRLAEDNGAAVFSSDVTIGDEQGDGSVPGGGQIVIRVVPAQLDDLVSALDGAGIVTRLSQDSQDVTERLVDIDIRIRQIESSIGRLETLLDQAGALDDVFELERELTNRVIELEQLRAWERNTENLVALATLTVEIEYRTPDAIDVIESGQDGIGDAFSDGWDAFVGFVFAIGYVLAISAPFLLAVAALGLMTGSITRRLARRSARRREQERTAADFGASASSVSVPVPSSPQPPVPSAHVDRGDATERSVQQPGHTLTAADERDVSDGDASPAG
ncbi:MAG: DUF4349 domain-containing protein [Ilumatobacter sp.]